MPGLTQRRTMTRCHHAPIRGALLGGTALMALFGLMETAAQAADWTGTLSNDWFTAGNWNPAAIPTSGVDVTANNNATPNPAAINAAGAVANSVTLGSNAGQFGTLNIARASSADVDTVHVAAYGGTAEVPCNLRLSTACAWHSIETKREVVFPGFADNDSADYHGETGQIFGEVSYDIVLGALKVEPFAGLSYVPLHTSSLGESDGAGALTGIRNTTDLPYSSLGFSTSTDSDADRDPDGQASRLRRVAARVSPPRAISEARARQQRREFPGIGLSLARDSALVDAGFDLPLRPNATLGLPYSGQFASGRSDHGIKGNFVWNF